MIGLSWRERLQLVNSVLFCLVGGALMLRYLQRPSALMTIVLGALFLVFGLYRLSIAGREMRRRAGSGN